MDGVTGNAPMFSVFSRVNLQVLVSAMLKYAYPQILDAEHRRRAKTERSYSFTK